MTTPTPLETWVPRQRWDFLRAELRWAYRGSTYPYHSERRAYVPHTSAWLILQGAAKVRTAAGQVSAGVGHWLMAPPGERWQQTSEDCKILSVCFVWQWIFGYELFPLQAGLKLAAADAPLLKSAGLRLAKTQENSFPGSRNDLPRQTGAIGAHLKLQTDFNAWLAHYATAMMRQGIRPCLMTLNPRVEEALQMLDRPGRNLLRPAELSKKLGVSQSQMNRLFSRQLGMTVHEYCRRQKLALARMHLSGSELSVKEIAFRLGFISPQHFSRWFRQHSGTSPTQMRQSGVPMI